MRNKNLIAQGLVWGAWITFIISLFLPIEHHTMSLEVSRFCSGRAVYCGYQNAIFFVLSPLFLLLNLVQGIQTAIFYPEMMGAASYIVLTMGIYSILGVGQVLVVLAPLWPIKIKRPARQKLHFWILLLSSLSVLAYGLFPDIRLGVDVLSGYYVWTLSFLLLLAASVLIMNMKKESPNISVG